MPLTSKIESTVIKKSIYPCLMKQRSSQMIVLFSSDGSGVVVEPVAAYTIGWHSAMWGMHNFEPFTGSIILTQD